MSEERISLQFTRKFSLSSPGGAVTAWLRENYGGAVPEYVVVALKTLYYPIALAESGEDAVVVQREIRRSRANFEGLMTQALGLLVGESTIPTVESHSIHTPPSSVKSQADEEDDFQLDESKLFD